MRSLISYYGGKQRLAQRIINYLPPHTVYVEPFCGGASVLFAKPKPQPSNRDHYREVLNDHDERLITIYRVAQDPVQRQALLERLTYTPYSRAEYERSRAIHQTWDAHDLVTQAWAMVVGFQQGFAHKIDGGWRIGVYTRQDSSTQAVWQKALPALLDRLAEVYVECDDAVAVIKRWDSPQTCFYVDPPYVGADQGPYKGYTERDLKGLIEVLDACQGSFVLSGYASPLIPSQWEHHTIQAYSSASIIGNTNGHDRTRAATAEELGDRCRVEHLWRMDRSANMRRALQAIAINRRHQGVLALGAD